MIEKRECDRCGKEYYTEVEFKRVAKCDTCDDTEYIMVKDYMPLCKDCKDKSMGQRIKEAIWKPRNMK